MQKLISKYALAAHLGLITAAPLFLFPYCSVGWIAVTLFWLSALGAIWVVMEPSRIGDEMPHNARERVIKTLVRDPVAYFLLAALGYAVIRVCNGGIGMHYDFAAKSWSIKEAAWEYLPGCVDGHGLLPIAVLTAMLPVVLGIRNALGKKARIAYALTVTILAGTAGLFYGFEFLTNDATILNLSICDYAEPAFMGMAFGVALLLGTVAMFGANEYRWIKPELLLVPALIGCAAGLAVFSSLPVLLAFLAATLIMIVIGFVSTRTVLEGTGPFRCGIFFMTLVVAMGFLAVSVEPNTGLGARVAALQELKMFPDWFWQARELLSGVAEKAFKANPWLGSGLGSFKLDIRFLAGGGIFRSIRPGQAMALQGWWQLAAERGVVGSMFFVVGFMFLAWTYVSRHAVWFAQLQWRPLNFLFPVLTAAAVAVTFFECSAFRSEVLLILTAALALSANAAPSVKSTQAKKE